MLLRTRLPPTAYPAYSAGATFTTCASIEPSAAFGPIAATRAPALISAQAPPSNRVLSLTRTVVVVAAAPVVAGLVTTNVTVGQTAAGR